MSNGPVIRDPDQLSASWLSQVLKQGVEAFSLAAGSGNWSSQWSIKARLGDGSTRALRLKLCLGDTFGRSEVDYYTLDYLGMVDAPLVQCFDAQYEPGVGYHLLLEDLADTHVDNKLLPPSLDHGLAVAEALGRFHRHHWCTQPAPDRRVLDRYLDEVRPGLQPMEQITGCSLRERFELHEKAFRDRWSQPHGMSLLHGDLNPTNILSPRSGHAPLYFLDRQPFDWSLTYGVAASDLAYCMIPWWPEATTQACEYAILRRWYESLNAPGYSWSQALADWRLSVEQCLNVPMEWCSKPSTVEAMQWLWQLQFSRVQVALARHDHFESAMSFDPEDQYVYLGQDGQGRTTPGGPAFWSLPPAEMAAFEDGWLVSEFVCSADWPNWEMHPEGEEFVYLLSGDIEFLQELASGISTTRISGRGAVLVPRGIWHTAKVLSPSRMLFVTRGGGTQHRPAAEA